MSVARAACEVTLHPGMICAEDSVSLVRTVLGSCVSVCLYDPVQRRGGINHYVLPLWNGEGLPSPRYGNIAIQKLLEKMEAIGSRREHLVAKLFGGGYLLGPPPGLLNVGLRNVRLAEDMLGEARIRIVARDVGGECSRKLIFMTESGEVRVRKLGSGRALP